MMSLEPCVLCNKDATPWYHVREGHLCADCYHGATSTQWFSIDKKLPGVNLMNDENMILETADVKTCPHRYVFSGLCPQCKGWISVKDRFPPYEKQFLTHETGYVRMPVKVNYILNNFTNKFAYGKTENITHWMPLPELPHE